MALPGLMVLLVPALEAWAPLVLAWAVWVLLGLVWADRANLDLLGAVPVVLALAVRELLGPWVLVDQVFLAQA